MFGKWWTVIKDTVNGFLADELVSRGASIAYFTLFSIAPLLVIIIAIAGLVFGHDAAQRAILGQFGGLMGKESADAIQGMIKGSNAENNGAWATLIGVGTLLLTASGAFGEIQSSLNKIWKAEPKAGLSRLVRARIAGLGLVLTLAFLMIASLVVSAGLAALSNYLNSVFPAVHVVMAVANFVISVGLLAVLFDAIYKLLPDKPIEWRDVAVGAVATAILFTIGKSLIGLYIGHSKIASGYGAAGALVVMLVWIYYSAEIFLFGAEFTRAYAQLHGSHAKQAKPETAMQAGAGDWLSGTGTRGGTQAGGERSRAVARAARIARRDGAARDERHVAGDPRPDAAQPGARSGRCARSGGRAAVMVPDRGSGGGFRRIA